MIDFSAQEMSEQQRRAVEGLMEAFAGDQAKAVQALKDLGELRPIGPRSTHEPLGEVLLSVDNITKQYKIGRQKLEALKGVSLNIHKGEFVAITGASGSGKSTLLQLMGGLDKPTTGEILFKDRNIGRLSDKKLSEFRRQTVGFVFQFFYLQPFLKLSTNLEVPGMFMHTKTHERHKKTSLLAEQVGLSDRLRHLPRELSGGQMQRAAIARALFNQPEIILADEPTGNLDSVNGKGIINLFEEVRDKLGTTVVIVTHDQSVAGRADRVIAMRDGVIL